MDLGDKTVLVVEDETLVLAGLTMILEAWGLTVLGAEDMDQVMARLEEGRPDLILSDLRLRGGLSGFDVVERVRSRVGDDLPAIILTGETGKAELEEGRRRNLSFMHKPVLPDDLRRAVTGGLASVC
ncbi:MAG: response regulator [Solirubrobacterales bacterium]